MGVRFIGGFRPPQGVIRGGKLDGSPDLFTFQSDLSPSAGQTFGVYMALSNDGSTLVIGDTTNDTIGTDKGAAHIYKNSGSSWVFHSSIYMDSSISSINKQFGGGVDVSDNGNIITVASIEINTSTPNDSTGVSVYQLNGGSYDFKTHLVDETPSPANAGSFGYGVRKQSVSGDGSTVAIGNPSRVSQAGGVHIYKAGSGADWTTSSNIYNFLGPSNSHFLYGVYTSISYDGTVVAEGHTGREWLGSNYTAGSRVIRTTGGWLSGNSVYTALNTTSIYDSGDFSTNPGLYFNMRYVNVSADGSIVSMAHPVDFNTGTRISGGRIYTSVWNGSGYGSGGGAPTDTIDPYDDPVIFGNYLMLSSNGRHMVCQRTDGDSRFVDVFGYWDDAWQFVESIQLADSSGPYPTGLNSDKLVMYYADGTPSARTYVR